ncbi:MAG: CoA transferase [Dehalococcoidales bacterium]|nr:CoA transferase [Dehalococcoidales bacterium]
MDNSSLNGLKVLDMTDCNTYLCGQIFASLGADVIKVEPPTGDAGRYSPPFVHDVPGPNRSLNWLSYNTGKRSLTLDLHNDSDKYLFKKLVLKSDIILESFEPGYLDSLGIGYQDLHKINPSIIMTSITPFGQKGPYSKYKGSDLIVQAMSGVLYGQGDPDRPPVRVSVPQGFLLASTEAAEGTMIAYHYKEQTGIGQHVDVSVMDSLVWIISISFPFVIETGQVPTRIGNATRLGAGVPAPSIWRCKDGFVTYVILGGQVGSRTNLHLAQWMAEKNADIDFMKGRDWSVWDRAKASKEDIDNLVTAIGIFFNNHTKDELQIEAFKRDIQLYEVSEISDLLINEQLESRKFWHNIEDETIGESITYPGDFCKLSLTPLVKLSRAPSIGENNEKLKKELEDSTTPQIIERPVEFKTQKALSGLNVLTCVTAGVGPILARTLALHGATVVNIESEKYPDVTRTMGFFKDKKPSPDRSWVYAYTNPEKYVISVDLKNPSAAEIKRKLIAWADVIVDNFRPGVMDRFGMSFAEINTINPRAVVVSSSQQGQTGPYRTFAGAGPHLVGYVGFSALSGWPDKLPIYIGPYPDYIAPKFANTAILAALEVVKKTGKGQFIDTSQLEAGIHFLTPAVLDYTINKTVRTRNGNKSYCGAPHGVYQCKGIDEWCAIAIFTDKEWESFCLVLGNPIWTTDEKFKDLMGRKQYEDELNNLVEEWTLKYNSVDVMKTLQEAGIAAGKVRTIPELFNDPSLDGRHYWWNVKHPEMGEITILGGVSYLLSETPYEITKPSPCLGEHTFYVCSKILGMSDEEIIALDQQGVLK